MKITSKRNYPYLGISSAVSYLNINPLIILFTGERKGVVVGNENHLHKFGEYYDQWNENIFVPYNGTITISD